MFAAAIIAGSSDAVLGCHLIAVEKLITEGNDPRSLSTWVPPGAG